MKTTTIKRKTKRSFLKTTVFKKLLVLLTIVNDDPLLTIVNESRGGERKPTIVIRFLKVQNK